MARQRSPDRDKAFEMWEKSGGSIKLKDIAAALGLKDSQIRKWKSQDKWDELLNGNVTNSKSNVTNKGGAPQGNKNAVGHGAPKGNQNAVGNSGGHGGPPGNSKAVTHGFFRKYFPEELHDLIDDVSQIEKLDMLWMSIQTQFTAIVHAQKVMFVRDQQDETRVIKKMKGLAWNEVTKQMEPEEIEYEIQHAWDKHATFLNAQARAMSELRGLIKDFLRLSGEDDHRRLQLEKMQQDIRIQNEKLAMEKERLEMEKKKIDPPIDDAHEQNSGYEEALNAQVEDVFVDEVIDDGQED